MELLSKIERRLKREYHERILNPKKVKGRTKIFCVGRNKTGTTSFKRAMQDLNYIIGNQRKAELLLKEYKSENFKSIIDYCHSAQVFQDFPFSFPETYKWVDKAFPHSKFILTVRDTPEQWYNSVTKYHSKLFGNGKLPTKTDLENANYVWKGWIWECNRLVYKTPEDDVYNRELLIQTYIDYNEAVKEYFRNQPDKLLVINLNERNSYQKLMSFLEIDSPFSEFPWENKTQNIHSK